ncbi:MAG: MaoC family dehydratase [Paracoccaceae bacterium]
MFFDDLPVGYTFTTGTRQLGLDEILEYARKYDPQPFHLDADAAANSHFGGIVASGMHTLSAAFTLTLQADIWNEASQGSPGMNDVRWLLPVRPADILTVRAEVVKSTPLRSRPDTGMTEITYDVLNQNGETVMRYTIIHMLFRRPAK